MFRDRAHDELQIAAAPTLERIRRDRDRVPRQVKPLFAHLEENLFDPDLDAQRAQQAAGIRDHSLTTVFRDFTGETLKVYFTRSRIEVAVRLLRNTEIEIGRIALAVGYTCHSTFIRNFKRLLRKQPSEFRRQSSSPEVGADSIWDRARHGGIDLAGARQFVDEAVRRNPAVEQVLNERARGALVESRIVVDGERYERVNAEGLWQEIRDLPREEQRLQVRRHLFHSTALFDLLREKSRVEGRKDRGCGIEVADLGLVSLEGGEQIFGERIHDLRALGWAWLGNAHRLALDFSEAEQAFERADQEWSQPEAPQEPLLAGEIYLLKGALRMSQQDYDKAIELVDQSRGLFRDAANANGEVRTLTQRASICGYAESLEDSIAALQQAAYLINGQEEPYLAFTVSLNLANSLGRAGQFSAASRHLDEARSRCRTLDSPLVSCELNWVAAFIQHGLGDVRSTERLYLDAQLGFAEANELSGFSLTSLDLANFYAQQKRWPEVVSQASEVVPILEALELQKEMVAAVDLLSKAPQHT